MNELCTVCTFVGVQKCNRNREWICLRHKTLPSQNISNVAQKHPHVGWIEINSETIIYSIILWKIPCDIVCELVLHVTIPFSYPSFRSVSSSSSSECPLIFFFEHYTNWINIFANILDFVCLFIYLFFSRVCLKMATSMLFSHPFITVSSITTITTTQALNSRNVWQ